mmetsp:Transcript_12119/g.48764  ORF Transcript_12119/g.48764 Transcript_12119/m.48764 type:complete len:239 (-) Transcript_12119:811-1527(-)
MERGVAVIGGEQCALWQESGGVTQQSGIDAPILHQTREQRAIHGLPGHGRVLEKGGRVISFGVAECPLYPIAGETLLWAPVEYCVEHFPGNESAPHGDAERMVEARLSWGDCEAFLWCTANYLHCCSNIRVCRLLRALTESTEDSLRPEMELYLHQKFPGVAPIQERQQDPVLATQGSSVRGKEEKLLAHAAVHPRHQYFCRAVAMSNCELQERHMTVREAAIECRLARGECREEGER